MAKRLVEINIKKRETKLQEDESLYKALNIANRLLDQVERKKLQFGGFKFFKVKSPNCKSEFLLGLRRESQKDDCETRSQDRDFGIEGVLGQFEGRHRLAKILLIIEMV